MAALPPQSDSMEHYHLINQIGEGSFGRVYKARRKYTGRLVAIKMINKLGQTKDDLDSFRREIDLLQKVKHPNIMRMLSHCETDTDFCVVSELARGDLFQVIDDNQTLPEDVLKCVAAQLFSSMAHLHSLKIIHRDMKPQNILIAEKGTLKICDFGFARALSQTTLVLTSVKGTPLYMSPELVQEQPYDEKVDVWALGVILYELFHGKPPFFTNSIYKLIQMIVNKSIVWPPEMSSTFKSFLMEMLQKDPKQRATCESLLKHPFISDVPLEQFNDRVYRFKSEQFDRAIQQSLGGRQKQAFRPKKSQLPDFQVIFINPTGHGDEELLLAVKYLREKNVAPDNPLAASFAFHFKVFISRPTVVEEALLAAADLLRKDLDRFAPPFATGVKLLGDPTMPVSGADFFTELLTIPFAQNVVQNNDFQLGNMELDKPKSEVLRDRLLSFVFSSNQDTVARTYTLLSFFAQESDCVLDVLSGSFAPQLVPILTSAICMKAAAPMQCSAFCILPKIVHHNDGPIKFVQPFAKFLDAFNNIVNQDITTIEELYVFSAAVSFIAVALTSLVDLPEFVKRYSVRASLLTLPNFLQIIFTGKKTREDRLQSLLSIASVPPRSEVELMCYSSVLSSPFCHIPIQESFLESCCDCIVNMVPMHQPALLGTLLALQPQNVLAFLPSMVGLFVSLSCSMILSDYIIQVLASPAPHVEYIVNALCESGILSMISSLICELGPSNVAVLLAQIILTFQNPTELLIDQAAEILNSIFSIESAAESALIIASHLARLSKDFLAPLTECGALNIVERALGAEVPRIRAKGLDFVGNLCRHTALPPEYLDSIVPLLVADLSDPDPVCRKLSAFAIGNVLFQSPEACELVMADIESVTRLLQESDPKTVENTAGILGNLVRKSGQFIANLIGDGAVEALVQTLGKYPDLEGKTIVPLSAFCQYDEARRYLRTINSQKLVARYANSTNERVKRYSQIVISSLS
jgi:fused-like protein